MASENDNHHQAVQTILMMFAGSDITASIVSKLLESNNGNIESTIDELLNLTSDITAASIFKSRAVNAGFSVTALPGIAGPSSAGGNYVESSLARIQAERIADEESRRKKDVEGLLAQQKAAEAFRTQQAAKAQEALRKEREMKLAALKEAQVQVHRGKDDGTLPPALPVQKMGDGVDPADFLSDLGNISAHKLDKARLDADKRALDEAKRIREEALKEEAELARRALELRQREEAMRRQEELLAMKLAAAANADAPDHSKVLSTNKMDPTITDGSALITSEEIAAATAVAAASENADSPSNGPPPAPTVAITYCAGATGETLKEMMEIQGLFEKRGVKAADIRMVDATHDPELQAYFREKSGDAELVFPMVIVHDQPLGNLKKLLELDAEGALEKLLSAGPLEEPQGATCDGDPNAPELSIGVLGSMLNAGEYVVSGVSSLLWLPVTILTWPFRGAEEELPAGEDFLVVHQNWYWRNLHRIFRFTDKHIMRIHPVHKDVRASHNYDTVARVVEQDESNIIIMYTDGSSPDYIRAPPKSIQRMLSLMDTHSNGTIKLQRTSLVNIN